jgi:hypothetical protein
VLASGICLEDTEDVETYAAVTITRLLKITAKFAASAIYFVLARLAKSAKHVVG